MQDGLRRVFWLRLLWQGVRVGGGEIRRWSQPSLLEQRPGFYPGQPAEPAAVSSPCVSQPQIDSVAPDTDTVGNQRVPGSPLPCYQMTLPKVGFHLSERPLIPQSDFFFLFCPGGVVWHVNKGATGGL